MEFPATDSIVRSMKRIFNLGIPVLLAALATGVEAQTNQVRIIDHLMDESRISSPRSKPVEYVMLHFSSDVVGLGAAVSPR